MPSSRSDEPSSISQVGGVWAASITPRRESGHEVDLGAALEIIDFLNGFSIEGIALFSSIGEFVHFDFEDRMKLVQMAIRRSRKPVIVNATHSTYSGTLTLADAALEAGAVGILAMPPYYFHYSQDALREYFNGLARDLRGPIFLYNIPFFTTPIEAETAAELLSSGAFAGMNDSGGRDDYFQQIHAVPNRERIRVLVGNDKIFARVRREGADGLISGVAMMAPELMVALDTAIEAGNAEEIARLEALLNECFPWLDRFPVPVAIKMAASFRGLKVGPLALPSGTSEKELLREFENWFRDWRSRIAA